MSQKELKEYFKARIISRQLKMKYCLEQKLGAIEMYRITVTKYPDLASEMDQKRREVRLLENFQKAQASQENCR